MKKCPVKNCSSKTFAKLAIIAAGVMTLIAAVTVLLHFFPQLCPFCHGDED